MNLKDSQVELNILNIQEFKGLLQKAADQSEQLQETLEQVKSFELKVDARLKP